MTLDEQDLKNGLKFIVGTWQPDFIVSLASNDLAHIPVAEFKTKDGKDFTGLEFEFFEDHTMEMRNANDSKSAKGQWEQTGFGTFKCTVNNILEDGSQQTVNQPLELNWQENNLAFGLGIIVISMKKIAEGKITEVKKLDIGDIEPSAEDLKMKEVVGSYKVVKMVAYIDDKFEQFEKEVIAADCQKKIAAGEMEDRDAERSLAIFDSIVEFTDDYKVLNWTPLPKDISDDEVKAALEAGQISQVKDGRFLAEEKEWKAVNGAYYYNTKEHRVVFDELKSSWDKIEIDQNGCIALEFMTIKKI